MKPSPFPGMDPYLEAPHIWPDVHTSLMTVFREQLAPALSPNYLAELETHLVIDRSGAENDLFAARPDVSVTRLNEAALVYTASPPPVVAPLRWRLPQAPTRIVTILIRERQNRKLVTVIELLSPVNKRQGEGREDYLAKRDAYLYSALNLVEIDLLRSYPRMPFDEAPPACDYLVMVHRAGDQDACDIWPISVRQTLPLLPIPLLPPDPDATLDMGQALRTGYERARYDLRLDYSLPPAPSLEGEDATWAAWLMTQPAAAAQA